VYNKTTPATPATNTVKINGVTMAQGLNILGAVNPANGVLYAAANANLYTRYSTLMRKYDQADRNQNILNTRVNFAASEDLDVGVNMQVKRVSYPNSYYGLTRDNQDSLGVDTTFQPTMESMVTAFYNYQKGKKGMSMNAGIAGATVCTAPGAPFNAVACADNFGPNTGARPDAAAWTSETTDVNNVLGIGLQQDLGFARLGVDYTYARSTTHIAYNYGTQAFATAASGNNAAIMAVAGTALPDMTTLQNTFTINLVKPLDKKTTVRGMYRFDSFRVADWHYDGVIKNALAAYDGGTMLLDAGPMNYHVSTFGVFLNYKL
jgi:hypothetical protein